MKNGTQSPRLVDVQDLSVRFSSSGRETDAVRHVSFHVEPGETVAIVGESGSGKTVSALSIMKLLPYPAASHPSGRILLNGDNVLEMDERAMQKLRGDTVSMIFQEPMTSLNPLHTVEKQIGEILEIHGGIDGVPLRDKVQFFNAFILSKLRYGLSSVWLVAAQRRRIDGFVARCLRRILNIP